MDVWGRCQPWVCDTFCQIRNSCHGLPAVWIWPACNAQSAPYFSVWERIVGQYQSWATLGLALGPSASQALFGCCQKLQMWSVVLGTKAGVPSWGRAREFACLAELREAPPERGRRGGTWQKLRLPHRPPRKTKPYVPARAGAVVLGREMFPWGNYCSPSPINHSSFPSSA